MKCLVPKAFIGCFIKHIDLGSMFPVMHLNHTKYEALFCDDEE